MMRFGGTPLTDLAPRPTATRLRGPSYRRFRRFYTIAKLLLLLPLAAAMAPPRLELFYKSPAQLNSLGTLVGRTRCAGVNLTNKDRNDDVIGEASAFIAAVSPAEVDVCAHFAVKQQWRGADRKGRKAEDVSFGRWCDFYAAARQAGVARVLLVSGSPPKKPLDALGFLQREATRRRHFGAPAAGARRPRIGVAFSPYILDEAARVEERTRLDAKIATGLVDDVWLQFGGDAARLHEELTFLRVAYADDSGELPFELHGSMFVPTAQWLARFRFRPWNGVVLSEAFLASLDDAERGCRAILDVYREFGVRVLIESPTHTDADVARNERFLDGPVSASADAPRTTVNSSTPPDGASAAPLPLEPPPGPPGPPSSSPSRASTPLVDTAAPASKRPRVDEMPTAARAADDSAGETAAARADMAPAADTAVATPPGGGGTTIALLRNELRLTDNPVLLRCAELGAHVVPAFV